MNIPSQSTETGVDRQVRTQFAGVDNLLADIKYALPRCNVEIEIRKAAATVIQNFCRHTGVFICITDEITVVDQQEDYEIFTPWEADISVIKEVKQYGYDASSVKSKNPAILSTGSYNIVDNLASDAVYLRVNPVLSASVSNVSTLEIELELIPSYDEMIGEDACSIPDKLMRRWRQAFVSGTIYSLASMTNRGWTNTGLAEYHKEVWQAAHDEAIDKARVSNMSRGSSTMRSKTQWV